MVLRENVYTNSVQLSLQWYLSESMQVSAQTHLMSTDPDNCQFRRYTVRTDPDTVRDCNLIKNMPVIAINTLIKYYSEMSIKVLLSLLFVTWTV